MSCARRIAKQGERKTRSAGLDHHQHPPATEETPAPDEATAEATSEAAPHRAHRRFPDADDLGDVTSALALATHPAASRGERSALDA